MTIPPFQRSHPAVWRYGARIPGMPRDIPEEAALALTYNRETYAVMMGTPADLEDFAVGFTVTEGIVARPEEIVALEVLEHAQGIELRMDLAVPRLAELTGRRRRMAGPTGCGLCGIDSLAEAVRPPRPVPAGGTVSAAQIAEAMRAIEDLQVLNRATHAVHGAAFWHPAQGITALREDVGRHNALDKLVGAVTRSGHRAAEGMVLLSSRVSIEMVQKAAVLGAPVLVAVSAPTAHAVRLAEAAGMTLVAIARRDGFEVFCGAHRITGAPGTEAPAHVA
jgi:FdhD protein